MGKSGINPLRLLLGALLLHISQASCILTRSKSLIHSYENNSALQHFTVTNLENKAVATRSTPAGSPIVPSLDEIKGIQHIHFHVNMDTPDVQSAVNYQVAKFQEAFPDWTFTVEFGKK